MVNPSPTTLVHSLKKPHWRIDVHRPKGAQCECEFMVFLTGMVAPDLHRSRYMKLDLFVSVANSIDHARKHLPELLADVSPDDLPQFPEATGTLISSGAAHRVHLVLCRRNGVLDKALAIYDADDNEAPMLIASNDEIDELCRDCCSVLGYFGISCDE